MNGCGLSFAQFQDFIRGRYGAKDEQRGTAKTFLWFMEEVGELASALQKRSGGLAHPDDKGLPGREAFPGKDGAELAGEFADVLGWLTTLDNMEGVDLESALHDRYLRDGGRDHKT